MALEPCLDNNCLWCFKLPVDVGLKKNIFLLLLPRRELKVFWGRNLFYHLRSYWREEVTELVRNYKLITYDLIIFKEIIFGYLCLKQSRSFFGIFEIPEAAPYFFEIFYFWSRIWNSLLYTDVLTLL